MGHASNLGLALAWLSPIILGFIVAFVLKPFRDDRAADTRSSEQHKESGIDRLHHA